jgi:hypothetical protein
VRSPTADVLKLSNQATPFKVSSKLGKHAPSLPLLHLPYDAGHGRPVDEDTDRWPVLLHGRLLPLQLLHQPQDVGVGDVKAGLPDVVLDLHVGVVLAEDLAGLALGPVSGRVQGSPPVKVLNVDLGARRYHQAEIMRYKK